MVAQHFLNDRGDSNPAMAAIRATALNVKVGQLFKFVPADRAVQQRAVAALGHFNDESAK